MSGKAIKILLTVFVALGGVAFLAYQSIGDVEYYVHVEDVVKEPAKWATKKTVQVHGFAHAVKPGVMEGQSIFHTFQLESKGKMITIRHEGVVPDTFKEEAETVVKGTIVQQPDGSLLLTTVGGEPGIMAKCPSKYQGKK